MKSLSARKAQRAKQQADAAKERDESPSQGADEGDTKTKPFDATGWVNDTVENIVAQLGDLSDDELTAVEQAEAAKKNRVSVMAAIQEDRSRRSNGVAGWNAG